MSQLKSAFGATFDVRNEPVRTLIVSALLTGLPLALFGYLWLGIGDAHLPILPSAFAWLLLLISGRQALPGIVLGATLAGAWCAITGVGPDGMTVGAWLLLMPVGVCAQASVFFAVTRWAVPDLRTTACNRDFARFLLLSGPAASAVAALVSALAAGPASQLPLAFVLTSGAAWWLVDLVAGLIMTTLCLGFLSKSPRPFVPMGMTAAAATILLGASVISGWLTHDTVLIQLNPSSTPMQFNTALGFVVSGVGLIFLMDGRRRLPMILGVGLMLVGCITLSQYFVDLNLGIDEMFVKHYVTVNTAHPGRMAPNTTLCFILFGLSLCQPKFGAREGVATSTLCTIVASIGLISLLSYAAGIDSAYTWGNMTPMALHTAAGFFALGIGGLAREIVPVEGAALRISLSPVPTGVALAAASIWVWQAVRHDEQERIRTLARDRAIDIARVIDMEITYHNRALDRMAKRWEVRAGTGWDEWSTDARAHLRDFPTVAAIARADESSRVRWLEPLEGNEDIVGFDLSSDPNGRDVMARVREADAQASTDVITLSGIGKGFLIFSPLRKHDIFDGYMVGLYRIDRLFEVLSPASMQNYRFRVFERDKVVFNSDPSTAWPEYTSEIFKIDSQMRGGLWTLQLIPQPQWLARQRSNLPMLILFTGLFLSAATMLALQLLEAVRGQYQIIQISENRFRQLIECAPTGLITVNKSGLICEVNPEGQRQFGYEANELIGKPIEVLIPERHAEKHARERMDYSRNPTTRAMDERSDLTAVKKNGMEFPVEVALAPFETPDGVQVLAMITDITERDVAQKKLEAHTRALELINKDLDDFAYVASHDLRAPLTAIGSLVQWLQEDAATTLPEESVRHLNLIENRVIRMGRLLEDLLDYSRAGRIQNRVETVDTAEMVPQLADLVRGPGLLALSTTGLPVLETVRTPLQQVLRNLISNAIKHHDRDQFRIDVSAREAGDFYIFQVMDDGPGIPAQYHSKIFKMFQTLRPRDEVEGSGMGLALVRKLVERYGGSVHVLESAGRGTTIEFSWPKNIVGD